MSAGDDVRTTPQALDAEEAVIGAILLDPAAITTVGPMLTAGCFYSRPLQMIFDAARSIHALGEPVDAMTVAAELQRRDLLMDVGGPARLGSLVSAVATTANIKAHARILLDYDRRRKLIRLSSYVGHICNNGGLDVGRVSRIEAAFRSLTSPTILSQNGKKPEVAPFIAASTNVVDLLLDTGYPPDAIIGAGLLRPRQFGLIYGAPGIGKTWVLLDLLVSAALGQPWYGIQTAPTVVGLASLELESWDLRDRLRAITTARQINADDLDGKIWFVSPPRFDGILDLLDPAGAAVVEEWIRRHAIRLAVIDTLARAHSAEEKDLREVSAVALGIARRTDSALLFCHHVRKPAPGAKASGGMFEARGDSRFLADARLIIGLEQRDELLRMTVEKTNTGAGVSPIWLTRSQETGVLTRTDGPTDRKVQAEERRADMKRMLEEAGEHGLASGEIAGPLEITPRTVQRYAREMGCVIVGKGRSARIRIATRDTGSSGCRDSRDLYED